MNTKNILKCIFVMLLLVISAPSWAQGENSSQRQSYGGGFSSRFKSSPLEGVWQACNIKEEGGKVQMQLIPCIKMVGTTGIYQDLTIKTSSEGSKVTENGIYIQINDSTYKREITACSDTVAAKKYKKEINVSLQGGNLLIISFTSNDGSDSYLEVWKRISNQAPISMMRSFRGGFSKGGPGNGSSQQNSSSQHRSQRSRGNAGGNAFQEEMNEAMQNMGGDNF